MVRTNAFCIIAGQPERGGIKGPQLDHRFCPDCKSWMFTRIAGMDDVLNMRPTMFDDPGWCHPFIETMTAHKLPWAQVPARHSYEGFPPPEDFQRLLDEFAATL
jgi:hypothetical protein